MEEKIEKLEKHLNYIWDLIPNKPTYSEFNKIISVNENNEILRNFEKDNNWYIIANYNKKNEGISTISLICSITNFLTNHKLSIMLEKNNKNLKDKKILGFKFIKD